MTPVQFRIAVIHALRESIEPTRTAFARHWPEALTFNLLDDSLSSAVAAAGGVTQAIIERFLELGRYAQLARVGDQATEAILFSCSAFGPAINAVAVQASIPVFRPNEAAFQQALDLRPSTINLLVSFPPSLAALMSELSNMAASRSILCELHGTVVAGAFAALQAGNRAEHDQLIAAAAAKLAERQIVILGQFSMAVARQLIEPQLQQRVLTTPDCVVSQMRAMLSAQRHGAPIS